MTKRDHLRIEAAVGKMTVDAAAVDMTKEGAITVDHAVEIDIDTTVTLPHPPDRVGMIVIASDETSTVQEIGKVVSIVAPTAGIIVVALDHPEEITTNLKVEIGVPEIKCPAFKVF
ncbi:hypothetical protein K7432_013326 [Basidiobolus ranarum]|uniref:Uncharacterized protein n=1 Tax=Basidiobolus ranarum TaxID=34480 RepID=A0ABR2VR49_9FUNG